MSRPNVVLIVLDSVRQDHVSAYGYHRPTTPTLDRIAQEGTLFTNAYAASCWTLPSHASLFTGLYPSEHRTDLDTKWLSDSVPTIASYLRERGYRTASISCNGFIGSHTNLTRGFETVIDVEGLVGGRNGLWPRAIRGIHRRWKTFTATDRGAARATGLAQKWLSSLAGGEPFFLFMNYMDCHLPYALKGAARYRFVKDADRARVDQVSQEPFGHVAGVRRYSPEDVTDLKRLYDGALRMLDGRIEELDRTLHDLGVAEATLFVITSDHGESFGEHDLFDHQFSLHEPLIRVPLIVRLPGDRSRSGVEDALVQHVDVLPSLAGIVTGAELSGTGKRALFGEERRSLAFAEYLVPNVAAVTRRFPNADTSAYRRSLRCVMDGRFKLVVSSTGEEELFDLVEDPGEAKDRSGLLPAVTGRLREAISSRLGPWPAADAEGADLSELTDRLEALGYL